MKHLLESYPFSFSTVDELKQASEQDFQIVSWERKSILYKAKQENSMY